MTYTIPSDTHTVGDTGHTTDHNNIVDALKANGAVYNVQAFGAVGDGVTDNTTALTNWVSALNAASGATGYVPAGQYMTNALPAITASGITIQGDGWAQTANTHGSVITCNATSSGALLTLSGEGGQVTGVTLDAANKANTCLAVTSLNCQIYNMQTRANTSTGVGVDVQTGGVSFWARDCRFNCSNGGTGIQVNDTDCIVIGCKPSSATNDVVLLSGSSGALLNGNHFTAGTSKQNCLQVNGSASRVTITGNRFDNFTFSAIQVTPTAATSPNSLSIVGNLFYSTTITDATYAVIAVDTTNSVSYSGLHIVGNTGSATGTNRPLYALAAQTQAGVAAANPGTIGTKGCLFNSNNFYVSSALLGTSVTPTAARGNILTTTGTSYSAMTDI